MWGVEQRERGRLGVGGGVVRSWDREMLCRKNKYLRYVKIKKKNFGKGEDYGQDWRKITATAMPFIYSFSGNSAASALISTFMCL